MKFALLILPFILSAEFNPETPLDRKNQICHDKWGSLPSPLTITGYTVGAVSKKARSMAPELTPAERYLRQRVDQLKKPRIPEENETLGIDSLDQAIQILGALTVDAFAQRPQAWQKLAHAVDYLRKVRAELGAELNKQEQV